MAIELQILGSNSATFAHNRHHTSQLLRIQGRYFLIDCGEGTQLQIKKYKVKLSGIDHIMISHLHGDHYYGLMGLIGTFHLYGRRADLNIYGPPGLSDIITLQLKYSATRLCYDIHFHEWTPGKIQVIYEDDKLNTSTVPLDHRIPCSGFFFREKPKKRRINKQVVDRPLSPAQADKLRNGKDLFDLEGNILYKNEEATMNPKPAYSYAYCSDTKFLPGLAETLKGTDLIYHESTFMDNMRNRALNTYHSTSKQAAQLAKDANAGQLLLGHFSTRYRDLRPLLREARSVFKESYLAEEGKTFIVNT